MTSRSEFGAETEGKEVVAAFPRGVQKKASESKSTSCNHVKTNI
jgi:hypothetical protein